MGIEYESDDFDMEQVAGVDNPVDAESTYDETANGVRRKNIAAVTPKNYTVQTRVKVRDKKTHQLVYKIVRTPSNKPSYQPRRTTKRKK